jgi:hypothetical protein
MLRTILATGLAVLLIVIGVWILWMVGARILQGTGPTAAPATDPQTVQTTQSLLLGMENGSMALGPVGEEGVLRAFEAAVADAPVEPLPPIVLPTVDPCPPQQEPGFAADANVVAIGMVRLYSEPDLESPALGEFSAGQSFLVTADANGVTAVRRCDLVWVRVRLTGGLLGWVLASAIEIAPVVTPIVTPVVFPTLPPICPGGCATPTCVDPCYDPCPQPCVDPCYLPCGGDYAQPCTTPCGVYSQ